MKRFIFILTCVLMAFSASAQSDSTLLLWVPVDQSVTLDYTGELGPKERATKIYLLPSVPDTLTTYKTVDGGMVPIYSLPVRYNTRPKLMEVGINGTIHYRVPRKYIDVYEPAVLTIEQVKACVGFPEGSPMHTTLTGIIDCHYKMALQNGATETEAANIALEKFSELMLTFNK